MKVRQLIKFLTKLGSEFEIHVDGYEKTSRKKCAVLGSVSGSGFQYPIWIYAAPEKKCPTWSGGPE